MPTYTLYYFNARGRAEIVRMIFAAAGQKYTDKRFEFNEWDKYRNDMPGSVVPCLEIDSNMKMPETMAIARYLAREFGFHGKNSIEMLKIDYISDCFYEIMHDYMRYYHWKNGRFRQNSMMSGDGLLSPCSDVSSSSSSSSSSSKDLSSPKGNMAKGMVNTKDQMTSKGQMKDINTKDMMNTKDYDQYLHWRFMNTCERVLPFLEKTLSMTNGGNKFFMGEQMMWCDMMCYSCLESPCMENNSILTKYPKLIALRTRVSTHPKIHVYLKGRSNSLW